MARSGGSVFAVPIDRDMTIDDFDDLSHIGTVLDCLTARLPEASIGYARGVRRQRRRPVGVRDRGSPRCAGRRCGRRRRATRRDSRPTARRARPATSPRSRSPVCRRNWSMAVAATGTPVVLVLVAGRPIGSPAVHAAAAAVLHAWLPGEAGADAISDALIGTVNPGGKLPISYPRQLRADPGVLRAQGVRRALVLAWRVRRHVQPPALPVRVRPVVHDVRGRARAARRSHRHHRRHARRVRRCSQRGPVARRRGRADLHARSGGIGDASGARVAGLRSRDRSTPANRRSSTSRSPSPISASTTGRVGTSSKRARSTSSQERPRQTSRPQGR